MTVAIDWMRVTGICALSVGLAAGSLQAACASRSGGSVEAPTPDRQSEAEYDLARDAWLRRGDARDGLGHTLKAVEIDAYNADAQHLLALIYLVLCQRSVQDCRLAEAEAAARRATKLRPDFREAQNTLGVVLIHERKVEEAVKTLEPLTRDILYATPESAWGNLGWALLELGRLDDARDALQRSIAAQPRFCVGHYRLGLVQEKLGQHEAAIASFTNALQADSRCAGLQDAILHRARNHLSLGHKESALADVSRCVRLSSDTLAGKECETIRLKLR